MLNKTGRTLHRLVVVILLLFGYGTSLEAQEDKLYIDRLGSNEGLSANYVNCILQDDDGFMWFGTFGGLNRYDGYEIREYKPTPNRPAGISGIRIFDIAADAAGDLWISVKEKGISFYDRSHDTFQTIAHEPDRSGSLPSNAVTDLLVDRQNRLWVGTDRGVSWLDLKDFTPGEPPTFTKVDLPVSSSKLIVRTIFEDRIGNVWVTTDGAVYRTSAPHVSQFRRLESATIQGAQIKSIVQTSSGDILLAGARGLYRQSSVNKDNFYQVGNLQRVASMAYDKDLEHLWVGSASGLYKYAMGGDREEPELLHHYTHDPWDPTSLSANDITSIFMDETKGIWVGTSGGGISKFNPLRKRFYHNEQSYGGPNFIAGTIRAIYQDSRQQVWVGSDGGGVNLSAEKLERGKQAEFRHYAEPSRVYAILEVDNDVEHSMYFGSSSGPGLFRLRLDRPGARVEPVTSVKEPVFALHEDKRGNIWLGTYGGGLYRWIPDVTDPTGYAQDRIGWETTGDKALPSKIVRSLASDKGGNLWVGTAAGAAVIDAAESVRVEPVMRIFRNVPGDDTSLSDDYVLPICVTRDGTVWIGTFGGGLNRFVPADEGGPDRFRTYGVKDGLANEVIKAIREDEQGDLWISSNEGLSKLDVGSGHFANYDRNDGLPSDEFGELAACQQGDGILIFGGVNGLTVFQPEDIRPDVTSARPAITGLNILNRPVAVGEERDGRVILPRQIGQLEEIELTYRQNSISFELAALHYAGPTKNRFAYKLAGFDEDWIRTTANQRTATYTNLPPGDYTFLLKVSNNDDVWNEEALSLNVAIAPPFWRTGAAYLFYALLFLAGAYLIRHYSIIGIKEKNEIELRKVDREKAEELNRLKLQFFTNISHELRTPLSLISGPLESLMNREPYVAPNQRREYYRLMQKNVGYLLRLVDELLDFRRLDRGMIDLNVRQSDLVSFLEEITAPFRFEAERDGIDFRLLAAERPFRVPFDPKVLEKVVFNLLANAFKFTGPAGSITLEVTKVSDDRFRIQVSDTGTGISTEAQGHIFERFYKSGQGDRTNQQGSGIGLAFTKSLVTLHQGEIGVNSEVGQGTIFHVLLPLHPEAYAPGELAPAPETVLPQAANPIDSLPVGPENTEDDRPCVLYVDDNADLRAYLHASLSDEFHVLTADNGRTGVKLARETFPDLIVSDLMMPEMDGMEVLQALKSDSLTSHIPVLLLTAKNNDESRLRGLRYGADAYLTKPFREDTLKQRIHNIVNHRDKLRDRFRREVIMEPEEVTVTDLDEIFLRRAVEVVEENISNTNFSVDQLGREMRVSRSHLYLKLKALTGQSASGFIRSIRLKRAVQLFDNTNYSIKEIRYRAGFNTPSYFSKCFKQEYGITPGEYYRQRKQASLND